MARSPAQRAAARRNMALAQAVSASLPRTAKQMAASRRNIVKAQAAEHGRPKTAKQIAAARINIRAAIAARWAGHVKKTPDQKRADRALRVAKQAGVARPKHAQTAKQRAASLANLAKAWAKPRTQAQIAASRANIKLAQAARRRK